jgi:isoleucyl-tRNA synthetase
MVDKDGLKMSKSLGNALDVAVLLKEYGADVARWWVSSVPYDGDIKIDLEYFRLAGESYRKVRNTIRFLLSNLEGFVPGARVPVEPASIDGWALAELATLQSTVRAAYAAYDFRAAHVAIFDFCNETLSAIYCAATKDRMYCDARDAARRRRTQQVT